MESLHQNRKHISLNDLVKSRGIVFLHLDKWKKDVRKMSKMSETGRIFIFACGGNISVSHLKSSDKSSRALV